MSHHQALLERAERGTPRGADAVWAAAQHRRRSQTLLVAAVLAAFVLGSAAVLITIGRTSQDGPLPVATDPPAADSRASGPCGPEADASVSFTGPAAPGEPCLVVTANGAGNAATVELRVGDAQPGGFGVHPCRVATSSQATATFTVDGIRYLIGDAAANTARVELTDAAGTVVTAETVGFGSVPGARYWVAAIDDIADIHQISQHDAGGEPVNLSSSGESRCP